MSCIGHGCFSIRCKLNIGWDGVLGFLRCDVVPDFLRAISLITENVASRNLQFRKKINSRICIMHLTAG